MILTKEILRLAKESVQIRKTCSMYMKSDGCDSCATAACGKAMAAFVDLIIEAGEVEEKDQSEEERVLH